MKNTIVLLAFLFVFSVSTLNAEALDCGRLNKLYTWMTDSLNLSSDQATQIKGMNDSACVKLQQIRATAGGDKELMKSQSRTIYQSLFTGYKTILTENQMIVLKNHKKNHKGNGIKQPHTPEQKASNMTAKLKTNLGLSETQESQVYTLSLNLINKKRSIADTANHSTEADKKESMKRAKKDYKDAMKILLNDEQEVLWQKMMDESAKSRKQKSAPKH